MFAIISFGRQKHVVFCPHFVMKSNVELPSPCRDASAGSPPGSWQSGEDGLNRQQHNRQEEFTSRIQHLTVPKKTLCAISKGLILSN